MKNHWNNQSNKNCEKVIKWLHQLWKVGEWNEKKLRIMKEFVPSLNLCGWARNIMKRCATAEVIEQAKISSGPRSILVIYRWYILPFWKERTFQYKIDERWVELLWKWQNWVVVYPRFAVKGFHKESGGGAEGLGMLPCWLPWWLPWWVPPALWCLLDCSLDEPCGSRRATE